MGKPLPKLSDLVGKGGGNHPAAKTAGLPALSDLVGKGGNHSKFKEKPAKHKGGFWHDVAKYSGAELAGNLAKDVGHTAVGVVPGIVHAGAAVAHDTKAIFTPNVPGHTGKGTKPDQVSKQVLEPMAKQYKDYYGHDVLHHLYTHPLQPILDAFTLASGGAGAAAKVGKVAADAGVISDTSRLAKLGERGTITTRSPRAMATGKGPTHVDLTSTKPLVKAREFAAAKARAKLPEGVKVGPVRVGGEVKQYGKQIHAAANQHALGHLTDYQPYVKATRRLSHNEWAALHIRAMDIHPNDLTALWKGTPAEKYATDPKVRALVLQPSSKIAAAETAARGLSLAGEKLLKDRRLLKDETALARPDLTKRQASEKLGRPVEQIHGTPYYLPHTLEHQAKPVSPIAAQGGGKGITRKLGSQKQNLGVLALTGRMHLRGDVLGPEFLRRVKKVKYDEIHNALVRGAVRLTAQEIKTHYGGQLPPGYEYIRTKPGQKIPATMQGEGTAPLKLDQLVPDPNDLHKSELAKGFSTTEATAAHTSGGRYYIVPKTMVKAATGEFTKSSDFTHAFVKRPLSVWRSAVLGLRVGFFTNNLVGNSVMYAVKTGGQGALRDLFMAIKEEHGANVARKALDSAATPPELRASLYKEFFPEQVQGTFGRTQSPSTSAVGTAANKGARAWQATTGAIPKVTSTVAEAGFRRGLIRHYIRHSPEFKKVYSSLPKQTKTFETAARHVLEGKAGVNAAAYQRLISKQVNQALGDYLNLSPMERNVLRNVVPFYAWYKAITVTTYHLAADTPLRANILGQLGQIGRQWSDEKLGEVPSFLEGSIPMGDGKNGTKRVLATQSLNPYATLEQLRRGGTEDFTQLGLNPFLSGALDTASKARSNGGKVAPGALVGGTLTGLAANLPLSRLAFPQKPSKLYPNRDRRSTFYGYLGAPVKEYNPNVAAQQARKGR